MAAEREIAQDTRTLHQRILAVMGEVSYIQKDGQMAEQAGGYKFVSHDAVVAKLRPAMLKHGVLSFPSVAHCEQNGNRTEMQIDVAFVNADDSEDRITIKTVGYGVDKQDKGPGKAISYAHKYALLKVFALETGEDADAGTEDFEPLSYAQEQEQRIQRQVCAALRTNIEVAAKARDITGRAVSAMAHSDHGCKYSKCDAGQLQQILDAIEAQPIPGAIEPPEADDAPGGEQAELATGDEPTPARLPPPEDTRSETRKRFEELSSAKVEQMIDARLKAERKAKRE